MFSHQITLGSINKVHVGIRKSMTRWIRSCSGIFGALASEGTPPLFGIGGESSDRLKGSTCECPNRSGPCWGPTGQGGPEAGVPKGMEFGGGGREGCSDITALPEGR
ncbi:hypothetical protein GCM10009642_18730 [Nocardiopsis metallicus]